MTLTCGIATWVTLGLGTLGPKFENYSANLIEPKVAGQMAAPLSGDVRFELDTNVLSRMGVTVSFKGDISDTEDPRVATFAAVLDSDFVRTNEYDFATNAAISLRMVGAIRLGRDGATYTVGNFSIQPSWDGAWMVISRLDDSEFQPAFLLDSVMIDLAVGANVVKISADMFLAQPVEATLGIHEADEWPIGRLTLETHESLEPIPIGLGGMAKRSAAKPNQDRLLTSPSIGRSETGAGGIAGSVGPDVIVGELPNVQRFGRVGTITAYSVATTSCNIGTERLDWFANNNNHPVIAQNMYRLRDGRFEQIGLSWLKHGFYALSGSVCQTCGDPTDGTQLGVGCSDPYGSGLNGEQPNLGPRHQVNASNGFFTYPPTGPGYAATIGRRIQVQDADLDPDLNAGAAYFVEGHYVTPDDAPQGGDLINNADNNASYRRILITESPANSNVFLASVSGPTQREKAAVAAWRDVDPDVVISNLDVPDDGRMILAHRVMELENGTWHYEYALQNLNSDRSASSFSLPIPAGVTITNIGFHDVDDHSGSPYDPTNWSDSTASGRLSWSGASYNENPNANALRWGSLYNFRFDADAPPAAGVVTIGLFKPGTPVSIDAAASVPQVALVLLASHPPVNSIDARQPFDIDGTQPSGWQLINLTFNGYALDLQPGDFSISQLGGADPAPYLLALLPSAEDAVDAVLSRPISAGAWTTITHLASGSSVRLGFLPGDSDGDGTAGSADILALIDHLNGVANPSLEHWQCDANRSGLCEPSDILRAIDLLNGAGAFDAFNGVSLP